MAQISLGVMHMLSRGIPIRKGDFVQVPFVTNSHIQTLESDETVKLVVQLPPEGAYTYIDVDVVGHDGKDIVCEVLDGLAP